MKSGLYACAGASATASAAACAKRFDEPITNRSNVYLGFIPASLAGAADGRGFASAAAGLGTSTGIRSVTESPTRRSWPVTSRTAAPIRPRKWPSIHSRVKSLGTPRTNASSDNSAPSASANHVRYVVSFRAPLSRPATSFHRVSAVSSIGRSTPSYHSSPPQGSGEHTSVSCERQWVETGEEKAAICRSFPHSTRLSTPVEEASQFATFGGTSTTPGCG